MRAKADLRADKGLANMNGWQDRHNEAVTAYHLNTHFRAFEPAIVGMLQAWALYAQDHKDRYDSPIGEDGVLGDEWKAIGLGIKGLLGGETGSRLDCGTLSTFISKTLAGNGISVDE